MDIDYLNELYREKEKQEDNRFKQLYSDIIDLLKYKSEMSLFEVGDKK